MRTVRIQEADDSVQQLGVRLKLSNQSFADMTTANNERAVLPVTVKAACKLISNQTTCGAESSEHQNARNPIQQQYNSWDLMRDNEEMIDRGDDQKGKRRGT